MWKVNPRKYLGSLLLLGFVAATLNVAAPRVEAQGNIHVLLDGREVGFGGVSPVQIGGRVLVPLRGVFEAMNAVVDYDAGERKVFASREGTQIQLTIGSRRAIVNDQVRMLDVPAQVRLGRTLVPLRFVSEALGAEVRWSEFQRTVYITTGFTEPSDNTPPPAPYPTTVPTAQPPIEQEPDYPVGQRVAINGVVTRNVRVSGFEMRTVDNTLIDVQAARRLMPVGLKAGDRVQVTGTLLADVLTADSVRIADDVPDQPPVVGTRATIRGAVTAILSATSLTMRNEAGTIINVDSRDNLPANIKIGDVVRATGLLVENHMHAERIVVVRSNDPVVEPDPADQAVNFSGIVESINAADRTVQIRGDNGQVYTVRYRGPANFKRNDRVRVSGTYANGTTTATTIERQ